MFNKNKKSNLPKYEQGGFGKKIGDAFMNNLTATGDIGLSALGMSNVIPDNAYQGDSAKFFRGYSDIAGGVAKAALPMAANMIAPGSGQLVSGAQGLASGMNPQDNSMVKYDSLGNPIYPQQRQSQQIGQVAGQLGNIAGGMFRGGGIMRYPHGGMMPNAEVELQENTLNPDGSSTQFNGPSHEGGGIPTKLDPNTLIFSDKLKHQGKTFAMLNKSNNTSKEDKVLGSKDHSNVAKQTAKLMKDTKVKNSLSLFQIQEQLKQSKVANYAKRMGLNVDLNEGMNTEGTFTMGGIQKYFGGGVVPKSGINFDDTNPLGYRPQNQFEANQMFQMEDNRSNPQFANYTDASPEDLNRIWAERAAGNTTPVDQSIPNVSRQDENITRPSVDNSRSVPNMGVPANQQVNPQTGQPNWFSRNKDSLYTAGSTLAQSAGQLMYLGEQGKNYDKQELYNYNPSLLNDTAAIRDANQEARIAEKGIRDASGGNAGTYLSNRTALNAQNTINKARIRESFENANTGIKNQAGQINLANKYSVDDINAQNKGKALGNYYNTIGSVGTNVAQGMKDNRQIGMDDKTIGMFSELYNNPEFKKFMTNYKKP